MILGDSVYVRSSTSNISFSLSGIDDTNIPGTELVDLENSIEAAQTQADKALVYALIDI